ncbi:DEAD/DEAH box helicase [Spirochaeta cellobiosiphila]|uniref:DEAD/DEAH box helicase n=1 Tax=Spirochaeta cellobiosiphila TaxID=504483 RepID=UPI00042395D3|nr:DEAD/DEAH box helicase [Spirochaeta cellobiosiphila]
MNFDKLGLIPEILKAIESRGYKTPTKVQSEAIPAILKGKDVLGGSQTGTGKTAAFALPILNKLSERGRSNKNPRALILTPTRELADQVGESFKDYGKHLDLKSASVYGGVSINPQIKNIKNGLDILIATPGRLLDHLRQKTINLENIKIFVLDEADRMFDMGFIQDVQKIIKYLPEQRQNLMFSATYDKDVRKLVNKILTNPVTVEVTKGNTPADMVEQKALYVDQKQKSSLLVHLMNKDNWYQVLVFVRTKHGADRLAKQLQQQNIPSAAIHGDKRQGARTRALEQFKKGDLQALIATDVAARGIHMNELGYVVNYDLPQVPEDYVHRVGRTGRAGKKGIAISFVTPDEKRQLQRIERLLKTNIDIFKEEGFVPDATVVTTPKKKPASPYGVQKGPKNRKGNESRGSVPSKPGSHKSFGRKPGSKHTSSSQKKSHPFPKGKLGYK